MCPAVLTKISSVQEGVFTATKYIVNSTRKIEPDLLSRSSVLVLDAAEQVGCGLDAVGALGFADVLMFHFVCGALELVDMLQGREERSKAVAQVEKRF